MLPSISVDILRLAEGKLCGREGAAAIAQLSRPTPWRCKLVQRGRRGALSSAVRVAVNLPALCALG
jgi:hypothetical protein